MFPSDPRISISIAVSAAIWICQLQKEQVFLRNKRNHNLGDLERRLGGDREALRESLRDFFTGDFDRERERYTFDSLIAGFEE
jgi:hypothetical protein